MLLKIEQAQYRNFKTTCLGGAVYYNIMVDVYHDEGISIEK